MSDKFTTSDLLAHVTEMFRGAADQGLYLGVGYASNIPVNEQEGPMVKRLRAIVNALNEEEQIRKETP